MYNEKEILEKMNKDIDYRSKTLIDLNATLRIAERNSALNDDEYDKFKEYKIAVVSLEVENKQLKERINKAIEYIQGVYEMASYSMSFLLDKENIEELEEILKGGSND